MTKVEPTGKIDDFPTQDDFNTVLNQLLKGGNNPADPRMQEVVNNTQERHDQSNFTLSAERNMAKLTELRHIATPA